MSQTVTDPIAQSCLTLAALTAEAEALSVKGMCQDDFEHYAQRITELEQHLAYLRYQAAERAEAEEAGLYQAELAAYKECPGPQEAEADPGSCDLCCSPLQPEGPKATLRSPAGAVGRFCSVDCLVDADAQSDPAPQAGGDDEDWDDTPF